MEKSFPLSLEFDGKACRYDECRNGLICTGAGKVGVKTGDGVFWSDGEHEFLMLPEDIVQPLKLVRKERGEK